MALELSRRTCFTCETQAHVFAPTPANVQVETRPQFVPPRQLSAGRTAIGLWRASTEERIVLAPPRASGTHVRAAPRLGGSDQRLLSSLRTLMLLYVRHTCACGGVSINLCDINALPHKPAAYTM
jgi:hypothetical protein